MCAADSVQGSYSGLLKASKRRLIWALLQRVCSGLTTQRFWRLWTMELYGSCMTVSAYWHGWRIIDFTRLTSWPCACCRCFFKV